MYGCVPEKRGGYCLPVKVQESLKWVAASESATIYALSILVFLSIRIHRVSSSNKSPDSFEVSSLGGTIKINYLQQKMMILKSF